jgi:sugar lactone lactonase YvrE
VITTVAGDGVRGYTGDGGLATSASLNWPASVTFDSAGNLYIADSGNDRIRKVDTGGVNWIITTVAGDGIRGYSGDGGLATSAHLFRPMDIAFDSGGNLYIADTNNNRIRKVDTSGVNWIITTVAGNGIEGYSGDNGLATSASLNWPFGITFDSLGNIYIADTGNDRIRKVDTSWIITTVAGNGIRDYSGDNGPATSASLWLPNDIAFDSLGNMFIADIGNASIRKVDTSWVITTVAGNGTPGYSGDGGPATSARLSLPSGVAFDSAGNMYIADRNNHRIREVLAMPTDTTPPTIKLTCTGTLNLNILAYASVNVTDAGSGVASQSATNGNNIVDTSTVGAKTFTVTATDNAGNTASNACSYQVIYDFQGAGGFLPPLGDPSTINTAKAGSTIPVKWQLPDGKGGFINDLSVVTGITYQQVKCSDFTIALENEAPAPSSGGSGLRYDTANNQFVYNWKTSSTMAGKCYVLVLKLKDGGKYKANFSLQ